jgi:2-oxoglutarate ferredoxin oxidoreductase subunit beta
MTTQPGVLRPVPLPYAEGSGHAVLHALIAEALEELDLRNAAIGVCSVGETFLMYDFFNMDFASAPPGRAVSVATGLKRAQPQAAVFTYQGDGDGFGAGFGDLVHAVARNEKITAFVVNNGNLGLSSGQGGRASVAQQALPVRACEMLAALGTPARIERVAVDTPEHIETARAAVREALRHAHAGTGTAVLEVLAAPTAWDDGEGGAVGVTKIPALPLGRFGVKK